ncbi:MAG: hypothetical protein ABIJ92_00580 [Candidatus Aenigmatarchaeota archaeon]
MKEIKNLLSKYKRSDMATEGYKRVVLGAGTIEPHHLLVVYSLFEPGSEVQAVDHKGRLLVKRGKRSHYKLLTTDSGLLVATSEDIPLPNEEPLASSYTDAHVGSTTPDAIDRIMSDWLKYLAETFGNQYQTALIADNLSMFSLGRSVYKPDGDNSIVVNTSQYSNKKPVSTLRLHSVDGIQDDIFDTGGCKNPLDVMNKLFEEEQSTFAAVAAFDGSVEPGAEMNRGEPRHRIIPPGSGEWQLHIRNRHK